MNLFQLLTEKTFGLFYGDSYEKVRWFESAASECSIDMEEGEEDFDVLCLSGIKDDDYVYFRADAEVVDAKEFHGDAVLIKNLDGTALTFRCYKVLKTSEIFS